MPDQINPGVTILRLTLKCHKIENDLAATIGLTVNELHCLLQLHLEKPCCVRKLTEILGIGATSTSKLLRSLDRRGYLMRTLDPDDRRKESVRLTEAGLQVGNRAIVLAQKISQQIIKQIPQERAESFGRCLSLLSADYEPLTPEQ
jgi:DNA-binding MarR family transcriptional regulator